MRIEFATIGNGTNVEVRLVEDFGPGVELLADRIYTADHQGGVWYGEDEGVPISARQLFEWVEDCWAPPVIGGRYGYLNPYWQERKERREQR